MILCASNLTGCTEFIVGGQSCSVMRFEKENSNISWLTFFTAYENIEMEGASVTYGFVKFERYGQNSEEYAERRTSCLYLLLVFTARLFVQRHRFRKGRIVCKNQRKSKTLCSQSEKSKGVHMSSI